MTMLSINTNIGALNSSQSSYGVNKSMETSMARLSSGKRINSGADDAAGLFITKRMARNPRFKPSCTKRRRCAGLSRNNRGCYGRSPYYSFKNKRISGSRVQMAPIQLKIELLFKPRLVICKEIEPNCN